MTFFQMLYQLLFGPLELLFEIVYGTARNIIVDVGSSIVPLSLCINFLLLPLYNRADAIQKEENEREKKMAAGVAHIKKTFKGDERYMMLQAYYRVNHHKPIYALRSSLPLLLEIPFFVAAYHFLSNLPDLEGAVMGPIRNLAAPDGLLTVGGISVNLLPILMTAINLLSGSIYAKDLARKDKLQLYGMALIFLVLLYNSPSGLVVYWTLNNLFSLVKNVVNAAQNRKFIFCAITAALGVLFLVDALVIYQRRDLNQVLVILIGLGFLFPSIRSLIRRKGGKPREGEAGTEEKTRIFALSSIFLAILTGLLIPSAVIRSSPGEFIVIGEYQSPLLYVFSTFLLAAGTFLIWLQVFHYLAGEKAKRIMEAGLWIVAILAVVNYMFFGTNFGNLSSELKYDLGLAPSVKSMLINGALLILTGTAVFVLWFKKRKLVQAFLPIMILAVLGMSVYNAVEIGGKLPQLKALTKQQNSEKASFTLSKSGRNVIVFMLDRAISSYVPYLFQENPELVRQFDGFTWYPNTLSYGAYTNTGSPALFGGYEYTPEEINKRDSESLVEKQNEALKVMPLLFSGAGYEATVCDPPYAGYTWIPDLSIFNGYEEIKAYNTENGEFADWNESLADKQQIWNRNFFCFSLMKISPLLLQPGIYQDGTYFTHQNEDALLWQIQLSMGPSVSFGVRDDFITSYYALCALPSMTSTTEDDCNTFLMMNNGTTHNVVLLQEPQYEPSSVVDNTQYDAEHTDRFTCNGRTMIAETANQMSHYQCNMAALIQLGKWFDYLREQGVYDNTRIIVVADHGRSLEQFEDMLFGVRDPDKTTLNPEDVMAYNPLLLVKDFGASGFSTDERFMTNADTPTLALDGLIEDPVNPFTGKRITNDAKNAEEQHVFYTDIWSTDRNNGNTFLPGSWYALVGHDIFDLSSWKKLGEY